MALRHEIFQALGDPTRLEIVERLRTKGPTPTVQLVQGLGMSRQAGTKHLYVLEQAGLVASRIQGRQVVRELNYQSLDEAAHWLSERGKSWEAKLDVLAAFVEGPV